MARSKAIYAGSFDPVTLGHAFVINEAVRLFDQVVIAVGENPAKKGQSMFTVAERVKMLEEMTSAYDESIQQVCSFRGRFLVDLAAHLKCTHIVRGIRNSRDFEEELAMAQINSELAQTRFANADDIPSTVFIPTPASLALISSSMVKSLIGFDGWETALLGYVPTVVASAIIAKVHGKTE
jgi:pantetheine-phosphate adenylyltransferase